MTYSNINPSVTQETASFASLPIYYNTIPLLDSIPHDAQVVVERIFTTELAGSTHTLEAFLTSPNVSPYHKRQIFKIPNTRLTFNQTTKTITQVYLPSSGTGVYNYITSGFSISVPPITAGQTITVERKTVSNVPLITWVPGSKLTTLQLNRAATQNLFLTQEILSLIDRKIAYDGNSTVEIPDNSITSAMIQAGAILPYHLSTTLLDWSLVGTLAISSLTASLPLFSDSNKKIVTRSITGVAASSVVLQDSPTLITPNLGTPSYLIGTNITGTATNFTSTTCTTIPALSGNVTSSGNVVTLNAAQTGITSLGTLTGLTVSGTSSLGILNTSGLSTLASLTVTGASSLNTLSTSGLSTLASLTVTGSSSLSTLSTSGLSTLASLSVTGASSLSTLSTSGLSTLASLTVTGASSLNTLGTSGLSTLASLTVTGASSLSTLGTSGLSTLASLSVTGASSLGSLTVSGSSSLNTLGISGTLGVSGASNLGVLNATGNALITGDLTIVGGISWTGNASGTSATSQQVADPKIYLAASPCAFTGSISGTTLTVTVMGNNQFLSVGTIITGTGVTTGTRVTAYLGATGTTGTYTVTPSQTVLSTPTMAGTGSSSSLSNGGGVVLMADGSIGNRTITCDTTNETWNFNQGIKLSSGKALILQGSTSGTVTITPAAAAGTTVLTLPATTDTLVGRLTTDTLTNKTLTAPVISSIINTGTLALPTASDTLVGRATTDTLTNKTWNSNVILGQYGGTGVANTSKTITLGGNLTTAGPFATTLTVGADTNVTLPTTGTLLTNSSTDTLTNKTWNGNVILGLYGGTGVANSGKTITLGGNLTTSFATTLNSSAATNVTLPLSGTLISDSSTDTLTNKTWNSNVIAGLYGGTGVANTGKTITLGGNLTTAGGAFATTLTATGTTGVTLPLTGTLATLAGVETLTNKTFIGPVLGTPASGNLSACTNIPTSALSGTIGVGNGGTGLTAIAANSVLISGTTANAITPLALGTPNQVLRVNSGGNGIEWGGSSGSTVLPTSGGGTGKDNTAWTKGCIVIGDGTTPGNLTTLDNDINGGYNGQVLIADSTTTNGVRWGLNGASTGTVLSGNQITDTSASGTTTAINFTAGTYYRNSVRFMNAQATMRQILCCTLQLGRVHEYFVYMPVASAATQVQFVLATYVGTQTVALEIVTKSGSISFLTPGFNYANVTNVNLTTDTSGIYKVIGLRVTQNYTPYSSTARTITLENLLN